MNMNMDVEDQLRLDMKRATRNIRVPQGLALKADRHRRKRQQMLRVRTAAATATALVGGVSIAGVAGAFGSPPAGPDAKLTAYVISHVQRALAPAAVDNLVGSVRETYPPGTTLTPVPGGMNAQVVGSGATSGWSVAYTIVWAHETTTRFSAYTGSGQPVFSAELTHSKSGPTETAVIYGNSTWWTAPVHTHNPGPGPVGCMQGGGVYLRPGPGGGWPGFIRSQLACGAYTVVGHQMLDGINAIKLTGSTAASITLLVDPATYRPLQVTSGPVRSTFRWLHASPANLAQLRVSVPAGFRQVQPPQPTQGP